MVLGGIICNKHHAKTRGKMYWLMMSNKLFVNCLHSQKSNILYQKQTNPWNSKGTTTNSYVSIAPTQKAGQIFAAQTASLRHLCGYSIALQTIGN
jgi:hypothetical protein